MLALLLLHANELVSPSRLIDELWAGSPPATAQNTLQQHLSHLRKRLGPELLVTGKGGYRLVADENDLDVARFERLLAQGKSELASGRPDRAATTLRDALSLWRGPALDELRDLPSIEAEGTRLDALRLEALEERIDADLELGRHAELCSELQSLVVEHPVRERLRTQLMLALYRSGRQAEALETYAEFRDLLNKRLGLQPGAAIRERQRAILNQDPGLAPPAAARAPVPTGRFIGRRSMLDEAESFLRSEDRLVTITGPPGVGKTRFALELAHDVAGEYPDGADFITLADVGDASGITAAIAEGLKLDPHQEGSLLDRIAAALAERQVLLILDDLTHLREGAVLLRALLASAPRLGIVVISRQPLRLSCEHVCRLTPLSELEAMMLFAERAQETRPDFELTVENDAVVAAICRRLDGVPLAIELAAACLRVFSPEAVLARLHQALPLLAAHEPERRTVAGHRTLQDSLARSFDDLPDSEQRILRALSIFPEPIGEAAAQELCGATSDDLQALVEKSMVIRVSVEGEPQFRLLQIIREYAAELEAAQKRGEYSRGLAYA